MRFLDEAKIFVKSGDGGPGCDLLPAREVRRVSAVPDGGDGGRGGDVVVRMRRPTSTRLIDYRYPPALSAPRSGNPGGAWVASAPVARGAKPIVLQVPPGTEVLERRPRRFVLADMTEAWPSHRPAAKAAATADVGNLLLTKASVEPGPPAGPVPGWPGEETLDLAAPEADCRCGG